MAYEISFTKNVAVPDPKAYFNDCCWGGDVVLEQLLPEISGRFEDVQANQEDWGWFIWFRQGKTRSSVNVFCDDPNTGKFRVQLTSQMKKFFGETEDLVELEKLRDIVCAKLETWAGSCAVEDVAL